MVRGCVAALLVLLTGAALAEAPYRATFEDGVDYRRLEVPTRSDGVLVVSALFSYASNPSRRLDAELADWAHTLPADVRFERVPAVFNRVWMLLARAYYVAEQCGALDVTHAATYRAIHDEGRLFRDEAEIADFYAGLVSRRPAGRCADREDFLAAFDSFEVANAVAQALALGRVWQPDAMPTLVVAGRWRTDPALAGAQALFAVTDHLIRRARIEADTDAGRSEH